MVRRDVLAGEISLSFLAYLFMFRHTCAPPPCYNVQSICTRTMVHNNMIFRKCYVLVKSFLLHFIGGYVMLDFIAVRTKMRNFNFTVLGWRVEQ